MLGYRTLQELLAPTTVVFTTCAWEVIGYKSQAAPNGDRIEYSAKYGRYLNDAVANITAIPEHILEDFPQSRTLPVQERMGWMARRTTTRIEDMAYCLLGIFGVHMALIYGEGEGAMARLEEEVRKREMSVAGSVYGGEDARSVVAPSLYGGGIRRADSPPPMPSIPRRAVTMQTDAAYPDRKTSLRQDTGDTIPVPKYEPRPVAPGQAVSSYDGGSTIRNGNMPPPTRSAPSAPATGLSERVSAWRDLTEEPTPSVIDEDPDQDGGDDTETIASWNTAPSEADTNFSGHAYSHGQFSPPVGNGAFHRGTINDLSDALPPPPPYPGPMPPPDSPASPMPAPSLGISRAQTFAPSTVGSTTSGGRPDLKSRVLLRKLEAERARRAKLEGSAASSASVPPLPSASAPPAPPGAFGLPSRAQTFATATPNDDLESLAPDDSASSVGGASSTVRSADSFSNHGRSLLRRLTEERERQRMNSRGSASSPTELGDPQGLGRSQTFASSTTGPLDMVSTIGSEIVGTHKSLRKMLKEERKALLDAHKRSRKDAKKAAEKT